MKILGILVIVYSILFIVIAVLRPRVVWNSKKTERLKKVLGERGAGIFFFFFSRQDYGKYI